MREISTQTITDAIKNLCIEANTNLGADVETALNEALKNETSPGAREILRQIIQNAEIARQEKLPLCQDTGTAIVFIDIGQDVHIINGDLTEAINAGVRAGYQEGYLRKSKCADPILRQNTGDNTPAIIHTEIVPGEKVKIGLLCKGGGAENKSALKLFKPTSPLKEIEAFIVETVKLAGGDACPPYIIGVGMGGNFDTAPLIAKKALLRHVGQHNSGKTTAEWERELLVKINKLGIGPMGLGGKTTALAVNVEKRPCHISSLPVAVNIECHAHRYKEITL